MSIISDMVDDAIDTINEKVASIGRELDNYQKSVDLRKEQIATLSLELSDLMDYKGIADAKSADKVKAMALAIKAGEAELAVQAQLEAKAAKVDVAQIKE